MVGEIKGGGNKRESVEFSIEPGGILTTVDTVCGKATQEIDSLCIENIGEVDSLAQQALTEFNAELDQRFAPGGVYRERFPGNVDWSENPARLLIGNYKPYKYGPDEDTTYAEIMRFPSAGNTAYYRVVLASLPINCDIETGESRRYWSKPIPGSYDELAKPDKGVELYSVNVWSGQRPDTNKKMTPAAVGKLFETLDRLDL